MPLCFFSTEWMRDNLDIAVNKKLSEPKEDNLGSNITYDVRLKIERKVFNEGTSSHSSAEPFIVPVYDPWQCTTAAEIDDLGGCTG